MATCGHRPEEPAGKWWKNAGGWYAFHGLALFPFSLKVDLASRRDRRTLFRGWLHQARLLLLRSSPHRGRTVLPVLPFLRLSRFTSPTSPAPSINIFPHGANVVLKLRSTCIYPSETRERVRRENEIYYPVCLQRSWMTADGKHGDDSRHARRNTTDRN